MGRWPVKRRWPDLVSRARTVAIGVPAVIAVAAWAPEKAWAVLVGAAALAAAWECMNLLTGGTKPVAAGAGAILALAVGAALYLMSGSSSRPLTLGVPWALVAMLLLAWLRTRLRPGLQHAVAKTMLSILFVAFYCGVLPAHLAMLRRDAGSAWTLLVLAVAWGGDVAGYLVGKALGGPGLAPSISPAKTVAGAVAGLVAALGAGLVFARIASPLDLTRLLLVVAAAGILSQAGDLGESLLKRRCGAKDSGATIPGCGGVLDCLDGLLLAAPWMLCAQRHLV